MELERLSVSHNVNHAPSYAEGRKKHVFVSVEDVVAYVRVAMPWTSPWEVAEYFDIHVGTARAKLDGALFRGDLVRDEYDEYGVRLHHEEWRYGYLGGLSEAPVSD